MNILLIQPAKFRRSLGGTDIYAFEPLGLEYIATDVINDHKVKILDN